MATQLFANNATGYLSASINTSATSIVLQSGQGGLFPNPSGGDWFLVTLFDGASTIEIVKCTARTADTLTVARAQEGTTAAAFAAGSLIELRATKGTFEGLVQREATETLTNKTLVAPALGTPASGVVTNLTGTASININGTVGATTANSVNATTLTTSSTVTHNAGTANGVAYLNSSKALTTGTGLTFDGTNLGVGTSSPSAKLDVVGVIVTRSDTFAAIRFKNAAGTDKAFLSYEDGTTAVYLNNYGSGPIVFKTADTERARIDSSGNLLVGATSSSGVERLSVSNSASGAAAAFNRTSNIDGVLRDMVQFNRGAANVGGISCSNTSTSYNTSSDYRLKENIQPMTGALAKVAQLKPCTYQWKADGSAGQGFIAHELAEVIPQCVTGVKDATRTEQYEVSAAVPATLDAEGKELTPAVAAVMGEREVPEYQGVDTSFLVATLTAALQETHVLIKNLQVRVDTLES